MNAALAISSGTGYMDSSQLVQSWINEIKTRHKIKKEQNVSLLYSLNAKLNCLGSKHKECYRKEQII